MAIGDKVVSDGVEFEVVWDGGEGLVGERDTKMTGFWEAPKRLYNKKSDYWKAPKSKRKEKPTIEENYEMSEAPEISGDSEA